MRQPPSKHANFVLIHVASSENEKSLNYLFEKKTWKIPKKAVTVPDPLKSVECHLNAIFVQLFPLILRKH
jgi:hypothetical protein